MSNFSKEDVDLTAEGKRMRRARPKIMHRDSGLCGIHLGGCGRPVAIDECTVDHIVPKALFESIAPTPSEFRREQNYQPMHGECNEKKMNMMEGRKLETFEKTIATGTNNTPDDWPRFRCKCHYLQILEGDMCVCTLGIVGVGEHKLYGGVVKDYDGIRQDAIMVVGKWKEKGKEMAGFDRRGNSVRGFLLPSFSSKRVPGFNISERGRVGLPVPKNIYVDESGYVTPLIS